MCKAAFFISIIAWIFSFLAIIYVPRPSKDIHKTLQVNYIQNDSLHNILLNVIERDNHYVVLTQEWFDSNPTFLITEIFDYVSD